MTKKIKYKSIQTSVQIDAYITNISSVIGDIKNATFEVIIDQINIFEQEDMILGMLTVKDNTGSMTAFLVGNRDTTTKELISEISENRKGKYWISGMVKTNIDLLYEDLKELTKGSIKRENLENKILLVKAIQGGE